MAASPDRADLDTPDSLRDDAAWERAFREMDDILLARLDRARDWKALYQDPLIDERIETWRKVRACALMFRALNYRSADGCQTVWNLREEIRTLRKDENLWYGLRMVQFMSPGGLLHRA